MTELDSVTSSSETEYLEWHLRNYEDMPREVILKMDLLRVGHWFTDAALELASDALVKSYRLFSYDLMSMKDSKLHSTSFPPVLASSCQFLHK